MTAGFKGDVQGRPLRLLTRVLQCYDFAMGRSSFDMVASPDDPSVFDDNAADHRIWTGATSGLRR
jgi:hypothetical protein